MSGRCLLEDAAADTPRAHFTFKQRNFDPETRQMRAREGAGEDTVEKAVEGLAEEIVKEDEARRAEELVSCSKRLLATAAHAPRTCSTSSPRGQTGT